MTKADLPKYVNCALCSAQAFYKGTTFLEGLHFGAAGYECPAGHRCYIRVEPKENECSTQKES